MTETALGAVGITEILDLLPHRYPFLMVDRIIAMKSDESAIGIQRRLGLIARLGGARPAGEQLARAPGVALGELQAGLGLCKLCAIHGVIEAEQHLSLVHLTRIAELDLSDHAGDLGAHDDGLVGAQRADGAHRIDHGGALDFLGLHGNGRHDAARCRLGAHGALRHDAHYCCHDCREPTHRRKASCPIELNGLV